MPSMSVPPIDISDVAGTAVQSGGGCHATTILTITPDSVLTTARRSFMVSISKRRQKDS